MQTDDLLLAAAQGDLQTIRACLDAGIDPNSIHRAGGNSALHNATYSDRAPAVKLLLDRGADPNLRLNYRSLVDDHEERGVVALMYALSVDAAKSLIDAGADVNLQDEAGITPLMRAAHRGKAEIVQLLLDAGADASQQTKRGQAAIDIVRDQIARYESWVVGTNRAPIAEKVGRLQRICEMLGA